MIPRRTGEREAGMVSAELATAVPALLLVLVAGVGAVRVGVDQVRCVDAARLAARALARGDPEGPARSLAERAAPAGSTVTVTSAGPEVTVEVSAGREVAGWRAVTVRGSATAQREVTGEVTGEGMR
ncbi:MAG: TadE family type IV pilus minor pilin [Lapillicoccus sp.]